MVLDLWLKTRQRTIHARRFAIYLGETIRERKGIMADDFDVDITPSVTTYELYQIASYTHWFAIGEFIDNSITSAFLNWDNLQKIYGNK